ncbi:MAG: DEAD/DEAH box helicase [Acholeplasmatales bacterium]|jgi:ATP-dependent DNA helicase RecG|nr:DEAD/DEAH box helicase [Acholeplasmatales bacterium]
MNELLRNLSYNKKTIQKLIKHNINTTYQLITTFPKNYDYLLPSEKIERDNNSTILITIKTEITEINKKNMTICKFIGTFKNETINFISFFKIYERKDDRVIVLGKYDEINNLFTIKKISNEKDSGIKPNYPFKDISSKMISKLIENIFKHNDYIIYNDINPKLIEEYNLYSKYETYYSLHFPDDNFNINKAITSNKYFEVYLYIKKTLFIVEKKTRIKKNIDIKEVKELISTLPFTLTESQKKACNNIIQKFYLNETSFTLLEGDTGSGKTIVSLIAMYAVSQNEQVALIAPTEILAKQHYDLFTKIIKNRTIMLLTSNSKTREEITNLLKNGEIDIIIGTHIIFSEDVIFKNLGLVVIDEQHKFGVLARESIYTKAASGIDTISLSATPIPRTLIEIFFNNTVLKLEKNINGRKEVVTKCITYEDLNIFFRVAKKELDKGNKVLCVAPAIDTNYSISVNKVYELLSKYFIDYDIFQIHGKMRPNEIEKNYFEFKQSKNGILIATKMIEEGIDIPNATVIAIFDAHFFGLSELHQLRGRVGRSNLESCAFLISDNSNTQRLGLLEKENDSFVLAEEDLKERGPGNFLGLSQSGNLSFKFFDFKKDYEIFLNVLNFFKNMNRK